MAVAVVKRENESSEKLISRWNKKCQASRVPNEVRYGRYFDQKKKNPNKRRIQNTALMREAHRVKRRQLEHY